MIKFKKIISSFLAGGLILSCLQSMVFANATVTWKETVGSKADAVDQIPSGVGYDPATGTFGTTGRTISYTAPSDVAKTYYSGVELPGLIKSGKIIAEVEFSGLSIVDARQLHLFAVSDTTTGWNGTVKSELVLRSTNKFRNSTEKALDETYRSYWNTDLITLNPGSGVQISAVNGVHHFKFIAQAASETADWNIDIYHMGISEEAPVYSYTILRSKLPDLKYILNYNYHGRGTASSFTLKKFKVKTFAANYGADLNAVYVPDANDSTDRIATINVSGTDIADINAVDAYIVNGDTVVETKLDNVSYENGVAQVTVPKSFYGNLSLKLVLKTEGGEFSRNVSFGDNNPFLESPIIAVLDSSLAYAAYDVSLTPEVDFKFNGTVVPTQEDSTPDDFSDNVKIYEYNNETFGEEISADNYTVVKSQDETNPSYDHLKITVTQPLEEEVTYAIVMDKIKKAGTEDIDSYSQEVIRTFTTLKKFKITANAVKTDDTAALDVTVRNVSLQAETKPYLIIMALMSDTNGVRKVHKTYYAEYPSQTLELQSETGAYAKELVVPTKNFTSVPANGYLKVMLWSKVNGPVEYTDEVIIPLNN